MILDNGEIEAVEEARRHREALSLKAMSEKSIGIRLKNFRKHVMQVITSYPNTLDTWQIARRDNSKIRLNETTISHYQDLQSRNEDGSYSDDVKGQITTEFDQKIAVQQTEIDLIKSTPTTADDISGDVRYKVTYKLGGFAKLDIDNNHD